MRNQELERAKDLILAGNVVGMPTETVYGLAASIESEAGLRKIFEIKERPFFDPLIVHISDRDQRKRVVSEWPDLAQFLSEKFWPGPLTMVLPKAPALNPLITSGLETVGIRMPSHPVAQNLIALCGVPLAAPSANKFGKTSPTKADHVRKSFEKEGILVLDGGQSDLGLESTVVKLEGGNLIVLRPGAITIEMLEETCKEFSGQVNISRASTMESPGNVQHHYMPSVPLILIRQEGLQLSNGDRENILKQFQLDRSAIGVELKLDLNPRLAARSLYGKMRESEETGADFIFVFQREKQVGGLWMAIWDRLGRAASLRV